MLLLEICLKILFFFCVVPNARGKILVVIDTNFFLNEFCIFVLKDKKVRSKSSIFFLIVYVLILKWSQISNFT